VSGYKRKKNPKLTLIPATLLRHRHLNPSRLEFADHVGSFAGVRLHLTPNKSHVLQKLKRQFVVIKKAR